MQRHTSPLGDFDRFLQRDHVPFFVPDVSDIEALLLGHRGTAVGTAGLTDVLLRVSRLADDIPEIAELDLNPVIARPDSVQAVDARIRIAPAHPQDPFLRRLR